MLDDLDVFDDHPSLDASLEDFENNSSSRRSPLFGLPSQHSGFRSEESDGEVEEPVSGERWSPPGLRQHDFVQGSGWYRHQPYSRTGNIDERLELKPTVGLSLSPSVSREASPQYEDALEGPVRRKSSDDPELGDLTFAANVPLTGTATPPTGRSPSPGPLQGGATRKTPEDDGLSFGAENLSNCRACLSREAAGFGIQALTVRILQTYVLQFAQRSNIVNRLPRSLATYAARSTALRAQNLTLPCRWSFYSSPLCSCELYFFPAFHNRSLTW